MKFDKFKNRHFYNECTLVRKYNPAWYFAKSQNTWIQYKTGFTLTPIDNNKYKLNTNSQELFLTPYEASMYTGNPEFYINSLKGDNNV